LGVVESLITVLSQIGQRDCSKHLENPLRIDKLIDRAWLSTFWGHGVHFLPKVLQKPLNN